MKKIFLSLSILLAAAFTTGVNAQMSVGTSAAPNANAVLDLVSGGNKGLLLPRVALTSTTSASPLSAHVAGMHVYNTATTGTYPNNVTPGEYYNDGAKWQRIGTATDANVVVATLASGGSNLLIGEGTWKYSGSSITLPPGRWLVSVCMVIGSSLTGTSLRVTNANEAWWVNTTFSDVSTGTITRSPDITGPHYVTGTLPPSTLYGLANGNIIINNTSSISKTYYYIANNGGGALNIPSGALLYNFGGTAFLENSIIAQRIY